MRSVNGARAAATRFSRWSEVRLDRAPFARPSVSERGAWGEGSRHPSLKPLSLGRRMPIVRAMVLLESEALPAGIACPDFALNGVDGKRYTRDGFASADVLVVMSRSMA